MKKLLILLFISLMLFISCSRGGGKPGESTAETSGNGQSSGTSEAISDSSAVTSGTNTDDPDFSAMKQVGDNLWEIPLPEYLSSNGHAYTGSGLYTNGNYLLCVYCDTSGLSDDAIIMLFDIRTGKQLAETRHTRQSRISLLNDGYVSIIDDSTLKTVILDPSFEVVSEYPAVGKDILTSLAFVSGDRKYFIWYSEDSRVTMKELATGEITDLGTVASDPAYCAEYNGTAYLITYFGDNGQVNYALDINTKTLTPLTEYNRSTPFGSSLPAFVHSEASSVIMLPDKPDKLYLFDELRADQSYMFDYRDGFFVSQIASEGIGTGVTLYSIQHSSKQTVELPSQNGEQYIGYIKLADNGAVVIDAVVDFKYSRLYMWLPDKASDGERVGITVTDRAGLLSRADSMRDRIKSLYGITVLYGKDGSNFNASDYVGETVTDEIRIYNAMTILNDTLAKYPRGIFGEMLDKGLNGFNFYLCGTLSGTQSWTISSALAITFTDYQSGTKRIVCDVGGYYMLDQTIAHELMHVMDDAIWNAEVNTGIPYYSMWLGLLPKGVDYYYYYVDENGVEPTDTSYTVMGEANDENIYFIDTYSKTYPTEDRARIMEYLFKTDNGQLSPSIRGEHLTEKCRALCLILRNVFPSVAAENGVFWESGLGTLNEDEINVFIERYREYERSLEGVG